MFKSLLLHLHLNYNLQKLVIFQIAMFLLILSPIPAPTILNNLDKSYHSRLLCL